MDSGHTFIGYFLLQGQAYRGNSLLLDLLILWHYKERMKTIWEAVWHNMKAKFRYPLWAYLLLPIFAIGLEIIIVIPKILTQWVTQPAKTIEQLSQIPKMIVELIERIGS